MTWSDSTAQIALRAMFDAAVASADPHRVLAAHLPEPPARGRVVVVGAGKSAGSMAAALETAWSHVPLSGVVVTLAGTAVPTRRIRVMEASHPRPDENSVRGAEAVLEAVRGLGPEDMVLVLISGGASAIMELPAPGLGIADIAALNQALLDCGAPIGAMNQVRKHMSAIKGGRLAVAAQPARVVTLAISDVPGDDPATIGSGPTVPDPSGWDEVREIARLYGLHLPRHDGPETPRPGSVPVDVRIIATPARALSAAADVARAHGLTPLVLGDAIEGNSEALGIATAGIARSVRRHGQPVAAPCVLLSGGETTVKLPDGHQGRGGRNTTFLLSLAVKLDGDTGIWALAGDTDGIDGNQDAAGAVIGPGTLARARAAGLNPAAVLAAHDSYTLFDRLGDLVRTGPTLTNVNDFRAVLIA